MRRHILAAGIAAAALIPSLAAAQVSCEQAQSNRAVGTVAGAGIGALIGSAVAGRGNHTTGALVGAVGGGLVGNQLARSDANCSHAYGYYDNDGQWHATSVQRSSANGYYDRSGQWMDGAPNGYYDGQGRWMTTTTEASTAGYYDAQGSWVPASASGYYDQRGQWVSGVASGHYERGRWVAGAAVGHYDSNGRWMAGQASGRRDANGVWVADAQPGYYDSDGRWRTGEAAGYYDTRGRWMATSNPSGWSDRQLIADSDDSYGTAPLNIRSMDVRIRRGVNDRTLTRSQGDRGLAALAAIRRQEMNLDHRRGRLSSRDAIRIQARLDNLDRSMGWSDQGPRTY